MKPRSPRAHVHVMARMRSGSVWNDICIKNMSRHGLMAELEEPPKPRSYVEIRRGTQILVGRVIWSRGHQFGLRLQDEIDIEAIVNEPRLASRPTQPDASQADAGERRRDVERRRVERNASHAERSRQLSNAMQFLVMVALGAIAAGFLASQVYRVMAVPFQAITNQL